MQRRNFVRLGLLAAAPAGALAADTFPSRPLRIVVPFNAGASVDGMARSVADLMRQKLGQPVIVDNKPGANTAIGASAVINSPPDGYTLFFATDSSLVLNPFLYKKLPYDPVRDFTAVALAAKVPLVMIVNALAPVKAVAEFVDRARREPGKYTYASTGNGGLYHLAAELLEQKAGIELTHVPYTGGAPAMQALLSGQVDTMFGVVGSALPYLQAGKIRALAVATPERVKALPDTPTLQECGYPGIEAMARYGLVAPRRTPPAVLAQLNEAMKFVLADAKFHERYSAEGYLVPAPHDAQEFEQILVHDRAMWGALIRQRKLTLD